MKVLHSVFTVVKLIAYDGWRAAFFDLITLRQSFRDSLVVTVV